MSTPTVRSWLSLIAQKKGILRNAPLVFELPNSGNRKPVCRSRRMAAPKKGTNGINGMFRTQNEAPVP